MAAAPCTGQKESASENVTIAISCFRSFLLRRKHRIVTRASVAARLPGTVTSIAGLADRSERRWAAEPAAAVPASPVCPSGAG